MKDQLRTIGVPAVLSAVISLAVVVVPFLFKIDERYAKAEDVTEQIRTLNSSVTALSNEVSKLTGIVEVVITLTNNDSGRYRGPYGSTRERSGTGISDLSGVPEEVPLASAVAPPPPAPPPLAATADANLLEEVVIPVIPAEVSEDGRRRVLDDAVNALRTSQRNLSRIANE